MYSDEDDFSAPATMSEAVREWAYNVGRDNPDRQWLLSDYDTWELNPFYNGPDQGHPEDDQWVGAPMDCYSEQEPLYTLNEDFDSDPEDRDLDFMDEENLPDDEYDGQPDEAQEWYDFDPDC